MAGLNINSFNEILLSAAKDEEAKIKILEAEIGMCADLFMNEVCVLLDELMSNGYKSEQFTKIQNIKDNSESLLTMLDELKGEKE